MARRSNPFKEEEFLLLKRIASDKWMRLQEKVEGLADKVYLEVMEAEMALARLNTGKISEKDLPAKQQSLLARISTFMK